MKAITGSFFLLLGCWAVLSSQPAMAKPKSAPTKTININQANVKILSSLKGIGNKRAQAIVNYRKKHGPYQSVDQLSVIRGISTNSLKKLSTRNHVKLVTGRAQ